MEKNWEAKRFDKLEVYSQEAFIIQIVASTGPTIRLETLVAGEHFESVVMDVSEKNRILTLETGFRPFFVPENDKLAAHKVISIEMRLYVPERLQVFVEAPKARLETSGKLKRLDANLKNGSCVLKGFLGNAFLNTQIGDIKVFALDQVGGTAHTKYGTMINELPSRQKYHIKAESVNGNISLLKSQE